MQHYVARNILFVLGACVNPEFTRTRTKLETGRILSETSLVDCARNSHKEQVLAVGRILSETLMKNLHGLTEQELRVLISSLTKLLKPRQGTPSSCPRKARRPWPENTGFALLFLSIFGCFVSLRLWDWGSRDVCWLRYFLALDIADPICASSQRFACLWIDDCRSRDP